LKKFIQKLTRDKMKVVGTPFIIAASPVTLVLSVYTLVNFGFYIAMNSISPVFLQKPLSSGGYGFNAMQNAECESAPYYLNML
jgi:sensor domain CHASE-containing protein